MTYTPRTTQPSSGDILWTKSGYGGVNPCILGSPSAWSGSVLANCTGYVHGRWMELAGTTSDLGLSLGNANTYYSYADGYERGQEPRLGAVLCLGGGSAGHVAIVEEILDNGDIMCSESNYSYTVFEYVRRYKSLGYKRSSGSVGGFQGFIYHPSIKSNYNVTCTNCTVTNTNPAEGDTVTVYSQVPSGYRLISWSVSGTSAPSGAPTSWSYTQPSNDVSITANIAKEYTVTAINCQPSTNHPIQGETVTVTTRTYKGYKLIRWDCSGISRPSGLPKKWSFTQPANNVTIQAVYRKSSIALYTSKQVYRKGVI